MEHWVVDDEENEDNGISSDMKSRYYYVKTDL